MNTNSLYVLRPYRYQASWVFDDPAVGLEREPFVFGIDAMIDCLVVSIPEAEKGSPTYNIEGWLCPALFKYFDVAPKEFYAKAEPLATAVP